LSFFIRATQEDTMVFETVVCRPLGFMADCQVVCKQAEKIFL